ncbi:GlsB/YeaQ/YmgE family stress response membrane protein [Archangium violaceum]|uniref:GlsB/YeaQ/YmgE family stress response membrane protein n=1 Tax=Archangium violaceum TaxID=83451 RepID=UPI00194DFDA5|nr:GlsB/YeaQ/YmgE family stress response membrane protein [Archangium violaceum]QRN95719.1 GlsB/YeaQ/YmgE family stress response membrane protein [Archangium violaceum]
MDAIFAYIAIGLVVGVIVRIALPPAPQVGFWGSVLLGMVGGLIGGLIGSTLTPNGALYALHPVGVTLAVIISALITVGVTLVTRRRRFG